MNTPGTIEDNWNWRFEAADFTPADRKKLLDLAKEYGR
jgi:4-alpha-glucanotransferase